MLVYPRLIQFMLFSKEMLVTEHRSISCPANISLKIITVKGKHRQYLFLLLPNISHSIIVRKDLTLSLFLSFSIFLSPFLSHI